MQDLSLGAQFGALAFLLVLSAMTSMTETVMMACNRYRLRSLASSGHRGARLARNLLDRTDRLLGVILLFNNLINIGAATLASVITIQLFGEQSWALAAGTILLTFLILVFSEITPKVIGAHHADRLALIVSYPLTALLRISYPAVWFVNLFVSAFLSVLRIRLDPDEKSALSLEELRSMVLESGQYIPQKNRDILLNLFDLEHITVEDVMVPRGMIENIDLRQSPSLIRHQLATSYHTRLPVLEGDNEMVVGVLHLRRVAAQALEGNFSRDSIRELVAPPYFVTADTHVYTQLQFFQENRQRMALVVDEYGELLGLITVEDIVEELIGKFTTSQPEARAHIAWNKDGWVLVDGSQNLRELNRQLDLDLPTDGPKTLNGLLLEHLETIPDADLSVRINDIPIEVINAEDKMIRLARIYRPKLASDTSAQTHAA